MSKPEARAAGIAFAAAALAHGELVAMPTETVYGLAADATNGRAVAAIYAAKGRPRFNPLIVHVPSLAAAERIADFPIAARRLGEALWPGPLTLVVPKRRTAPIADLATAGLDTVALRVPAHDVAQELLLACGLPLAAPSANRSGRLSPTEAAHVAADLGDRVACILDAGPTAHGLESTIVGFAERGPVLLRPGAVERARIEALLGRPLLAPNADPARPAAPGMLASHYAPTAKLRLAARDVRPGEAYLGFGKVSDEIRSQAAAFANLSEGTDLGEAAANLFAMLRRLDGKAAVIAVAPIPAEGLGEAINDRLARAAAPRG
jgi:L-threonylcarbamoyladenylate synthase